MKSLVEFLAESLLCEGLFKGDNWSHGGAFDYADQVITKLINGEDLKLGKEGKDGMLKAETFDKKKLQELQDNLPDSNYNDLNKCLNDQSIWGKKAIWTSLYKGDFSGYTGETSKNRGNAFEQEYVKNFATIYKPELEKLIGQTIDVDGEPKHEGGENKKRPLIFVDGQVYVTPKEMFKVGAYVTDVTLPLGKPIADMDNLYLSLKYGDTVTFINCGTNNSQIFPHKAFRDNDPNEFGPIGKYILDMLGIDHQRFVDVFASYRGKEKPKGSKRGGERIDVIRDIDKDKLMHFLRSGIGYGYVLVHKHANNTIHYYDILSEDKMKDLIGDIKSVKVEYPIDGNKKRVDVFVETDNMSLKINLRSKSSQYVYPTHIMMDYKFTKGGTDVH